ncbi:hypothetical protein Holit_03135 [Hollandina sp. SP2]
MAFPERLYDGALGGILAEALPGAQFGQGFQGFFVQSGEFLGVEFFQVFFFLDGLAVGVLAGVIGKEQGFFTPLLSGGLGYFFAIKPEPGQAAAFPSSKKERRTPKTGNLTAPQRPKPVKPRVAGDEECLFMLVNHHSALPSRFQVADQRIIEFPVAVRNG